jgi:hypothetical protein
MIGINKLHGVETFLKSLIVAPLVKNFAFNALEGSLQCLQGIAVLVGILAQI